MKRLFPYFKPYIWHSILGPLFKLLEATFELLVPVVVGLLVDKGLGVYVEGAGYVHADVDYIVKMSLLLVLFGVLGCVFAVVAQYFAARTATGVSAKIRSELFRRLQSLSYKDFDRLGTSTMLTRITGDVDRLQSGVNLALRLFLRSPFIVFGAVITAWIVDPGSVFTFILTVAALAVVVFSVMLGTMPLYKKSQEDLDALTLSTRENLTGVRVVRAFCREKEEEEIFDKRNEKLTRGRKVVGALSAITNPLTYVLVNGGILLLLYVGAIRVEDGLLTQGSVIALYNLMGQILVELIKFANLIVSVSKAVASGGRIGAVLTMQPSLETDEGLEEIGEDENAPFVEFRNVSMRYSDGGDPALENVSFALGRGQTLGVIGGTGSGKTTLVNLIPHFYDIYEGQVYVDGKNVREKSMQDYLRARIGVVPQKARLFKGTIRENLLWGRSDATDEELYEALKVAQALEVVADKGGLDAEVQQGGKNFSGGQKQRLTIARAIARKPDVLILDDSSSALDYATDAALKKALRGLDATVIIVSQRTFSVQNADQILVLDDGKVVGKGTHEQLLESCEEYQTIYRSQHTDAAKGVAV
ncbi:MAG: ABC transporter ATP-binding protein [Clostridia bacterium]|nr:ABC transporter ATP-binding protein [Clostridia bacterium]